MSQSVETTIKISKEYFDACVQATRRAVTKTVTVQSSLFTKHVQKLAKVSKNGHLSRMSQTLENFNLETAIDVYKLITLINVHAAYLMTVTESMF